MYERLGEQSERRFPVVDPDAIDAGTLSSMIDYTLLKPEITMSEYGSFLREASKWRFRSVFVPPYYVPMACGYLLATNVVVGTPVSFPFGYQCPEVKAQEALKALDDGARELDVVMNISAARSGAWDLVGEDLKVVEGAVRAWEAENSSDRIGLKVILETPYLSSEEIRRSCEVALDCGFDYVKTATGLGPGGATVEAVRLMRSVVGERMGVKAAGGVRDWKVAREMILAGADRIGTSTGPTIMEGFLRSQVG